MHPDDEFPSLKELCENLRASLPPLKEHQYQLVGLYLLAALYLGQGRDDYHKPIDRFYALDKLNNPPNPLKVVK